MSSNGGSGLVERLRADLDDLLAVDVAGLPDAALRAELLELFAVANQVHAAIGLRVASFDTRGLADADACRTTAVWVRNYGRCSDRAAADTVTRARVLRDLPALAAAAARGEVGVDHLGKIQTLVKHVGVAAVQPADQILADAAASLTVAELGLLCTRIHDHIDPDGPEPADLFDQRELTLTAAGGMMALRGRLDPEGAAAVREAIDALMKPPAPDDHRTVGQRRADALVDLARGALAHGNLPTVGGMRPQIGILITPHTLLHDQDPHRRTYTRFGDDIDPPDITHHFRTGDDPTRDDADPDEADRDEGERDDAERHHNADTEPPEDADDTGTTTEADSATPADHPPTSRRGDLDDPQHQPPPTAHAHPGGSPHGDPPDTGRGDPVTNPRGDPPDTARGDPVTNPRGDPPGTARGDPLAALGLPPPVERAWLHWYGAIPPTVAQRIACDADIWRIVLDPTTGLPLDVGRAHRLVPYWIRRALHARDRGCRWPGCSVPAPWTDGHHLTPWHAGGQTKIEDLLLLCRYHHTRVHEGHWKLRLDPTTGHVHITRPDGTPHNLGPSRPWTTPTTQTDARPGDPPDTS